MGLPIPNLQNHDLDLIQSLLDYDTAGSVLVQVRQ